MRGITKILKAIRPFCFLFIVLFSFSAFSAPHTKFKKFIGFPDATTGWGFNLGEPTSIRHTRFTGWKSAWSYGLGYSFDKILTGTTDYLWYFYNADDKIRDADFWNSLLFFAGAGVRAGLGLSGSDPGDNYQIGIRGVGGLEYIFINSPWSFRVELAPTFFIKAKGGFAVSATVGFTYYWFDGAGKGSKVPADTSEFD